MVPTTVIDIDSRMCAHGAVPGQSQRAILCKGRWAARCTRREL